MQFLRNLVISAVLLVVAAAPALAQTSKADTPIKIALHVDDNDAGRMNLALNNVMNILADYKKAGHKVQIEVVTYGPGLHMFREDTSPVKARIQEISLANPNVIFAACQNTQLNMSKAEKKDIKIIPEARLVASGVIHLVELQRQGFAYIKP